MTAHVSPPQTDAARAALDHAARRAVLAPSIHNTQPWAFVLTDDALEIRADRSRRLAVLDVRGRQLLISCGCALFHARVAIAASGFRPVVERFPVPLDHDLVARVRVGRSPGPAPLAQLDAAIERRRTNRRAFGGDPLPVEFERELVRAAQAEGAVLTPVHDPAHRSAIAELAALADTLESRDTAYRAELAAWTTDDPRRADGVQAASVPYAGPGADAPGDLPLRDFDPRGMGWLPSSGHSGTDQTLFVLGSPNNDRSDWVRAGEALERVWLELTLQGYWASPLTQIVEVAATHDQLRHRLRLPAHPQLLLRVGRAPEVPPTRRRPLTEVVIDRRTRPDGTASAAG